MNGQDGTINVCHKCWHYDWAHEEGVCPVKNCDCVGVGKEEEINAPNNRNAL